MHAVKAIALAVLAWPAAEIVVFFCVAATVGFANAVLLVVMMSVAGVVVLRRFGGGVRRMPTADGGFIAASAWGGEGLAPGLGGILLLIPGFLTSVLAVLILFPLSRRWLLAGFGRLVAPGRHRPAEPGIIDLAPDEWRPLPGTKLAPADDAAEGQQVKPPNQF